MKSLTHGHRDNDFTYGPQFTRLTPLQFNPSIPSGPLRGHGDPHEARQIPHDTKPHGPSVKSLTQVHRDNDFTYGPTFLTPTHP